MSWQVYVDQSLLGTKKVTQAGIYGLDGGGVWAQSSGFSVRFVNNSSHPQRRFKIF
jgi:hypothetical protein